jgi:hypothetical protein
MRSVRGALAANSAISKSSDSASLALEPLLLLLVLSLLRGRPIMAFTVSGSAVPKTGGTGGSLAFTAPDALRAAAAAAAAAWPAAGAGAAAAAAAVTAAGARLLVASARPSASSLSVTPLLLLLLLPPLVRSSSAYL